MNSLGKAFIVLFSFLGATLLFCALIRLANGKSAFISMTDLYYYFQDVDILKPFNKLVEYFTELKDNFVVDITDIQSWNTQINSFSDLWDSFLNFFSYIGKVLFDIVLFVGFPVVATYYSMEFLVSLFGTFFSFISAVLL